MIHLCGLPESLQTFSVLSASAAAPRELETLAGLKCAYRQFLGQVQPTLAQATADGYEFVDGGERLRDLVMAFNVESHLDDTPYELTVTPAGDDTGTRLRLQETLDTIAATAPDVAVAFDLAINTVFVAPCRIAGGGTTSSAIGVLWLDPRIGWTDADWIEITIHELTHTLLFMDEYRFEHYASRERITDRSVLALSAIRCDMRPLDKVFHSIVVATEVLLARERGFGNPPDSRMHPPSPVLVDNVSQSIASILAVGDIESRLQPRAFDLLEQCANVVADLASAPVASA